MSRLFAAPFLSLLLLARIVVETEHSALATDLNQLCVSNQVVSFKTEGLTHFSETGIDYCQVPVAQVPSAIAALITTLGTVHSKVASEFAMTPNQIFPNGVSILIKGSDIGSLDESTAANSIYLYEFSDWNGEPLNEPLYAHELGHVVALTDNPTSPSIRELQSRKLFTEAFPDLVSLATYGVVQEPAPQGVPACINQAARRDYSHSFSFEMPMGFFTTKYVYQSLNACFKADPSIDASAHTRSIEQFLAPYEAYSGFNDVPAGPFDPTWCGTPAADPNDPMPGCDAHQLGAPINSFLLAIGAGKADKVFPYFLQALKVAEKLPNRSFDCDYEGENYAHPVSVSLLPLRSVFDALKKILPSDGQMNFEAAWKASDMDAGMALTDLDETNRHPTIRALTAYMNLCVGGDSATCQNPCFQHTQFDGGDPAPGCKIVCKPKSSTAL